MSQEESPKEVEVYTLPDGTTVNKFCMGHFDDLITSMEAIWDVFDIVTKLSRLEVIRNEEGFVTDVELIMPRISEVVSTWACKNFLNVHKERGDSMSAETAMELRRFRLEKYLDGRK